MNFIDKMVQHKTYGEGQISNVDDKHISIAFTIGLKEFPFPQAFINGYLTTNDREINSLISTEKLRLQKEEIENRNKIVDTVINRTLPREESGRKKPRIKIFERSNVAFKCTYCDGGKTGQRLGFDGVCSDHMIKYNIITAKHSWCSQENCDCNLYLQGYMKRNAIDSLMDDGGSVCYESQMLRNWSASAGFYTSGEKYGKPIHMNRVQVNSLAILTTRLEKKSEAERIIFAVFLVDDTFEGDNREAGQVSTESKFKIELTLKEANTMKFWDYHSNGKNSKVPAWGSGLFRYLDDIVAAIILRDIAALKKGTPDSEIAQEFFKHYCTVNGVDINNLPLLNGALSRRFE
jgi:hypothetical protein